MKSREKRERDAERKKKWSLTTIGTFNVIHHWPGMTKEHIITGFPVKNELEYPVML
jgi:hypothetical protein